MTTHDKTASTTSQKGGVGKTTETANVGYEMARLGANVCMIDNDPSRNLTILTQSLPSEGQLGLTGAQLDRPELTLSEVIASQNPVAPHQVVRRVHPFWQPRPDLPWHQGGALLPGGQLHIVPAGLNLAPVGEDRSGNAPELRLTNALHRPIGDLPPFMSLFDAGLIDCQPSTGSLTRLALLGSRWVLMPVVPETLPKEGLVLAAGFVASFANDWSHTMYTAGVVINMWDREIPEHEQSVPEIRQWAERTLPGSTVPGEEFIGRVWDPIVPRRTAVIRKTAQLLPVAHELQESVAAKGLKKYNIIKHTVPFVSVYTRHALQMMQLLCPDKAAVAIQALRAYRDMPDEARDVLFGASATTVDADPAEQIHAAQTESATLSAAN